MMPRGWYLPGALLCILFLDGNFCAIFRSLYPQPAAIAFSLLGVDYQRQAFFTFPGTLEDYLRKLQQ